eukprot:13893548-Alexandrium_andersonii.AAC.1
MVLRARPQASAREPCSTQQPVNQRAWGNAQRFIQVYSRRTVPHSARRVVFSLERCAHPNPSTFCALPNAPTEKARGPIFSPAPQHGDSR